MAKKKTVSDYIDQAAKRVARTVRFPADVWKDSKKVASGRKPKKVSHNAFIVAAVRKAVAEARR